MRKVVEKKKKKKVTYRAMLRKLMRKSLEKGAPDGLRVKKGKGVKGFLG